VSQARRLIAIASLAAAMAMAFHTSAIAQAAVPAATPMQPNCPKTFPWPTTTTGTTTTTSYPSARIEGARFTYPKIRNLAPIVRFLVLTSPKATNNPLNFFVDNPPGQYWAPIQQDHDSPPSGKYQYSPYPNDSNPKKFQYADEPPVAAFALAPIYVDAGLQYCMVQQLTTTRLQSDQYVITQDFGTTDYSPVFATIIITFFKEKN